VATPGQQQSPFPTRAKASSGRRGQRPRTPAPGGCARAKGLCVRPPRGAGETRFRSVAPVWLCGSLRRSSSHSVRRRPPWSPLVPRATQVAAALTGTGPRPGSSALAAVPGPGPRPCRTLVLAPLLGPPTNPAGGAVDVRIGAPAAAAAAWSRLRRVALACKSPPGHGPPGAARLTAISRRHPHDSGAQAPRDICPAACAALPVGRPCPLRGVGKKVNAIAITITILLLKELLSRSHTSGVGFGYFIYP
jgi:hypothetical protein